MTFLNISISVVSFFDEIYSYTDTQAVFLMFAYVNFTFDVLLYMNLSLFLIKYSVFSWDFSM